MQTFDVLAISQCGGCLVGQSIDGTRPDDWITNGANGARGQFELSVQVDREGERERERERGRKRHEDNKTSLFSPCRETLKLQTQNKTGMIIEVIMIIKKVVIQYGVLELDLYPAGTPRDSCMLLAILLLKSLETSVDR